MLSLFNGPKMLYSASDKANLFAENFSKNSNLDDSGISLPVFPSRTNLKLHNISVTPKMVKKVITNLDSSKASGPDCNPVEVLKNYELEVSYILAQLFNMCLKESCFPDCWKVSSRVNNRIVDYLDKYGLFSDFQYGFSSSRSTVDLLTVGSDRIAKAFNRSVATRAVALDISKAFDRFWCVGLLHELESYGISGQFLGIISFFLSNRRFRLVLDGKPSQENPVNAEILQSSILGPTLFLFYNNNLPVDVICNIVIYANDTTLYSKCDQVSHHTDHYKCDLWQELELAPELESDR